MPDTIERTLVYQEPPRDILVSQAEAALLTAQAIVIDSQGAYEAWGGELVELRQSIKDLDAFRERLKRPFLAGGREIDDIFREPIAKRKEAAALVDHALTTYRKKQDAIRAEAQRLADKAAEEERRLLRQQAEEARAKGDEAAAATLRATAAVTMPATVPAAAPSAPGTYARKSRRARVTDLAVLLHYIADHPGTHECVEVRQAALNRLVEFGPVPGVVVDEVETTIARS